MKNKVMPYAIGKVLVRSVLTLVLIILASPSSARVETVGGPLVFGALANSNIDSVREQVEENPELVKARDKLDQTLLHLACTVGGFPEEQRAALPALVKFLLEKGADPNARDKNGESPLHRATAQEKESTEILAALLEKGADPNLEDNAGFSPLAKAKARGNSGAAKSIEAAGGRDALLPLLQAVSSGDRDEVLRLLAATPALAKAPDALKNAVVSRDAAMVELLLKSGANANERDPKTGRTPLFEAASRGAKTIVDVLLKNDADAKQLDTGQQSVLDAAQQAKQWDAAVLLVKAGAKSGTRYSNRNSLLQDAAIAGHIELINALLDAGENPARGNPLQKAIAVGQSEAAKVLLARGGPLDADADDLWNRGPLHLAAVKGDTAMIDLLLQKGAAINATTEQGETPLALAVRFNQREALELLLRNSADVNASERTLRPRGGEEPVVDDAAPEYSRALRFAVGNQRRDIIELLVKNGARFGHEFFDAILKRDVGRVKAMLQADATLANLDSTTLGGNQRRGGSALGHTPLHLAALLGDAAITQILVEAGAKLDTTYVTGVTALHYAASSGDESTVRLLLDKGMDAKLADKNGATPLHYAAAHADAARAVAVSTLLVKNGTDVGVKMGTNFSYFTDTGAGGGTSIPHWINRLLVRGGTALHLAARQNKAPLVQWLLENGATLAVEKGHWTALHEAARASATETVALLLARGAEVNAVAGGRTPLHEAIAPNIESSPGAEDNDVDWNKPEAALRRFWNRRLTPLNISPAARATVDVLLKNGADPLAIPHAYYGGDMATPLELAARARDRALTSVLVAAIKDIKAPLDLRYGTSPTGIYPLQRAAFFADQNAVELLLARGAEINAEDKSGRTALDDARNAPTSSASQSFETRYAPPPDDEAFLARRYAVAEYLSNKGGHAGRGTVYGAIFNNDFKAVGALLKESPTLLNMTFYGRTPLMQAIVHQRWQIAEFLLSLNPDLQARDVEGRTALFSAALHDQRVLVQSFLKKGADPNTPDLSGRTVLYAVKQEGAGKFPEMTALLENVGGKLESGLIEPIQSGNLAEVQRIIEADPEWLKRFIMAGHVTPLYYAVSRNKPALVEYLLSKGADSGAATSDGKTPLMSASNLKSQEIISLLLAGGADINFDPDAGRDPQYATDKDGKNVRYLIHPLLFHAIRSGDAAMVAFLIEKGARVNQKNLEGVSPLQFALQLKKDDIATLLREKGAQE